MHIYDLNALSELTASTNSSRSDETVEYRSTIYYMHACLYKIDKLLLWSKQTNVDQEEALEMQWMQ